MTPSQHAARIRELELQLELADYGLGMPLDRERVQWIKVQLELARKEEHRDRHRGNLITTAALHRERQAKRRLSAAAPDLLKALKVLVAMYGDNSASMDNARAAIAKAEGTQS